MKRIMFDTGRVSCKKLKVVVTDRELKNSG